MVAPGRRPWSAVGIMLLFIASAVTALAVNDHRPIHIAATIVAVTLGTWPLGRAVGRLLRAPRLSLQLIGVALFIIPFAVDALYVDGHRLARLTFFLVFILGLIGPWRLPRLILPAADRSST